MAGRRKLRARKKAEAEPIAAKPAESVGDPGSRSDTASDSRSVDALVSAVRDGADFMFLPSEDVSALFQGTLFARTGGSALVAESGGTKVLRLSRGRPDAVSAGPTGGFSIRVPDAIEAAASGNRIRVEVVARTAPGAAEGRLALAYSTNEVGNSGWAWREAAPDWAIHRLDYAVPPMRKGNGDFVAVLPEAEGAGVEVAAMALTVSKGESGF
jgi:hypothetical protein